MAIENIFSPKNPVEATHRPFKESVSEPLLDKSEKTFKVAGACLMQDIEKSNYPRYVPVIACKGNEKKSSLGLESNHAWGPKPHLWPILSHTRSKP